MNNKAIEEDRKKFIQAFAGKKIEKKNSTQNVSSITKIRGLLHRAYRDLSIFRRASQTKCK